MSGDPRDPNFQPGTGSGQNHDAHDLPNERSDAASAPRSGFRAPAPISPRPAHAGSPRPAAPWDLTTRVPVAGQRHVDPEDLTLFAMQLLSGDEAATISAHVEHCSECRRELAGIRGDLGAYAYTVEMHDPADGVREGLMRKVARERKAIPISHSRSAAIATFGRTTSILVPEEEEAATPSKGSRVLAWSGWVVAAALGVTSGIFYKDREALRDAMGSQSAQIARLTADAAQSKRLMDAVTDPHAQRVTLATKPLPPAPIGRATYDADKGTLVFLASDMDQLQPEKTYELWLIPADGSASLPAGTFRPDDQGNASVIMPPLPRGVAAKGFGVTIEDEGGAQTPTKPIIMVGF